MQAGAPWIFGAAAILFLIGLALAPGWIMVVIVVACGLMLAWPYRAAIWKWLNEVTNPLPPQ